MVRRLPDQGDRVLAVVRTPDPGLDVAQVVLDFGRPFEVPNELTGLSEIHGLVHCAGITDVARVEQTEVDLWERPLRVNLTAAAELTRLLLPGLQYADVLRLEERGLRVTTIYPDGTAQAIRPETIAGCVALVLGSPADAYPSNLTITGGSSS